MRPFVWVCVSVWRWGRNGFFSALALLLTLYYRPQIETAFSLYPQNVVKWKTVELWIEGNISVVCVGIGVFLLPCFCFLSFSTEQLHPVCLCNVITFKSVSGDSESVSGSAKQSRLMISYEKQSISWRLRAQNQSVSAVFALSLILQLQYL